MGGCISQPSDAYNAASAKEEKSRSDAIDRQIEEDAKKFKRECKILLLGSGESGKSTIVKQMKIIHQSGFSTDELKTFKPTIFSNIVDSAHCIVNELSKLGLLCDDFGNRERCDLIRDYTLNEVNQFGLTIEICAAIEAVWADKAIKRLLEDGGHSREFYLMDNAPYFFSNLSRIGAAGYVPTETDVLRARAKTTSISETRFAIGQLSIHMFDVGGQRSERRKWIHCFESVTSIIFCTAISEYDLVLLEEKNQNRMNESLILFESIINSRWFLRTSIVLFLNKVDVFKEKLPRVPLERYFPEYTGGNDVNKAAKYILWKFLQANRARLSVYPHLTQATDTTNIRLVFAVVKETILQNALKYSGIL